MLVPQGGVLSPLLYILYTSQIAENLPTTISVYQFADNVAIYTKFSFLKRATNSLEKSINSISKSLSDIDLQLTTSKTPLLYYNNKKILPDRAEIKVKNSIIKLRELARLFPILPCRYSCNKPQINFPTLKKKE